MTRNYQGPPEGFQFSNVPYPPLAGTWGVAHGSGPFASVIRMATQSWAGHAVMYVGGGMTVEARWPKVKYDAAPRENVIWATGQPLTVAQRTVAAKTAMNLVGGGYDLAVYPALMLALFKASLTKDLTSLFNSDKWWDCSALVEHCDAVAQAAMFPGTVGSEHFVTPAMMMNLGVQKGWFQGE
jgi:hypothetical protein